jgi:hypothetical protein
MVTKKEVKDTNKWGERWGKKCGERWEQLWPESYNLI